MLPRYPLLATTLAALMLTLPALAAEKDQPKRLQQQLRTAQQENKRLTSEKSDIENQLKDAQAKVSHAERRADAAGARGARLDKELEAARQGIAAAAAEKKVLVAKLADMERVLAELRLDKQRVELVLAGEKKAHAGCRERNGRMYELGNELLDRYEQKDCFTSMLQAEPFTGLKRAQIEKMIEADREKLDREQILPESAAATTREPNR